jgi:hypothetical protein
LPGWNCHINAPQEKFYSNFSLEKLNCSITFFWCME